MTVTTGRAGFDLMLARIEGLSFDGPDRAGADLELEVAAACARERLSELGAPQVLCARLDVALAIADAQRGMQRNEPELRQFALEGIDDALVQLAELKEPAPLLEARALALRGNLLAFFDPRAAVPVLERAVEMIRPTVEAIRDARMRGADAEVAQLQSRDGNAQRAPRLARPLKSHVFDHSREDDLMNFDIAMLLPVWIFGSALGIGVVLLIANAAPKRAAPAARMPPVIRPPIAPTAPLSR